MRRTLTIILTIIILGGCNDKASIDDSKKRNENWCWFVDEHTGEGTWVPIGNNTTLDDGDYSLFFCNGEIRQTGKLNDGKDCDTIFYYDLKGSLVSKVFQNESGELQEIMPDGKYKGYYATCELSVEGEFKRNKQVGKRTEYYKNGNIKAQSEAINGATWYATFNEQGQILDSVNSINGKLNGLAKYWYPNGQLEAIRYFKDDLRHGNFEFYFDNGQLKQKSRFVNDMRQDTVIDWYENGQLRFIRQYENDKRTGAITAWFENGNIKATGAFLNDQKHGEYKEYHENGKSYKEGKYKNGQKSGTWKYYDEGGNLIETEDFFDNEK